jgi:hypothetical protein
MASYRNFRRPEKKFGNYNPTNNIDEDYKFKTLEDLESEWRKYIGLWKSYPDKFIDFISNENTKIKLFGYQRVFLRLMFRYQYVFISAARGISKSYTEILAFYLKCMFFPGFEGVITAAFKEQAAKISKQNIEKIWEHFPVLRGEVKHINFAKDMTALTFKNGSSLRVVQMADADRGGRSMATGVEELVHPKFDLDKLNKIVIPMMANSRPSAFQGKTDPDEIHRSVIYVTSAGQRQSPAFQQMQDVGKKMANRDSAFLIGADYTLGGVYGHLDESFINQQREMFSVFDFQREYENIWTGSSDMALVDIDVVNDSRTVAESEETSTDPNAEYVLAYDVARSSTSTALSALTVIKIKQKNDWEYTKQLVNVYSDKGEHFLEQALFLKKMVAKYNAKILIIDSNGLGKGVVDYLVTDIDKNPVYEVVNDSSFDKYKTPTSIPMLFLLSTNKAEFKNSDIFDNFTAQMNNKKVKMLQHSAVAKLNLMENRGMKGEKLANAIRPYIMVDLLCDEISNLEYKNSTQGTAINPISKDMPKDKFMAFCYGLYWIHLEEKKNKTRTKETFNIMDSLLF